MKSEDLSLKLLEYPELIRISSQTVLAMTEKVEEQRRKLKEIIATASCKVNANPAFKNADQRKTELDRMLDADNDYKLSVEEEQRLTHCLATEKITYEYLNNMLRVYLAIAGMQGVE